MQQHLNTTKQRVNHLLAQFPVLRDDDKLLFLAYLVVFHNLKDCIGEEAYNMLKQKFMSPDIPSFESIRRCRQKLQEEGLHRGTRYLERQEVLQPEVRQWARG